MDDTAKYLIHADITTSGVVERSDVVGAIFGQTEGLLGDDLDLRDLQQSSKVGRIDVEVESREGQSFGRVTIASSLDRVETAVLAASLETITRVGPCRSRVQVARIEDVRAAKRREVVDRAKELLGSAFDDSVMSSEDILSEVRESVRVEDVTDYHGLPAGPRVADSDAVIVVEGRADVLTLLGYGIKNAVAVEGTDVPDAVADLSQDRTVTAFLDGDRGGDLILRELAQVADVDYVARAPSGSSVEDLDREAVTDALRKKVAFEETASAVAEAATDGSAQPAPADGEFTRGGTATEDAAPDEPTVPDATATVDDATAAESEVAPESEAVESAESEAAESASAEPESAEADADSEAADDLATLGAHVRAVVGDGSGRVRLLDAEFGTLAEADADDAFDAVESAEVVPTAVVVDGTVTQRLLDVAAQRGVARVVGRERGDYVKQPASVRVHTADELDL
jgi:DNA primase